MTFKSADTKLHIMNATHSYTKEFPCTCMVAELHVCKSMNRSPGWVGLGVEASAQGWKYTSSDWRFADPRKISSRRAPSVKKKGELSVRFVCSLFSGWVGV